MNRLVTLLCILACLSSGAAFAADGDGDGHDDALDNCPTLANDQADRDGDGIGDACQCGDASGDGTVNSVDARLIQRCAIGLIPCPALCDADGNRVCNSLDARLVQRRAVGALPADALTCSPDDPVRRALDEICSRVGLAAAHERLTGLLGTLDPATAPDAFRDATLLQAFTRVTVLPLGASDGGGPIDSLPELLDAIGVGAERRDPLGPPPDLPIRADGRCVPPADVGADEAVQAIRADLLPELEAALASLADLDPGVDLLCETENAFGEPVAFEIDDADVQILIAAYAGVAAALEILSAYDLGFALAEACDAYNATLPACEDPTRDLVGTNACQRFDGDEARCEAAFQFSAVEVFDIGSESCFVRPSNDCRPCTPSRSAAGLCENECAGSAPGTCDARDPLNQFLTCSLLPEGLCEQSWESPGSPHSCFLMPSTCEPCSFLTEAEGTCTEVCGRERPDPFDRGAFWDAHPDLGRLAAADAAVRAGDRLDDALSAFERALDALANETDEQTDDAFYLDPLRFPPEDEQRLREQIAALRASLAGEPRPIFEQCPDLSVDLMAFFSGRDLRALVPPFVDGLPDLTQAADPSFDGVLPGATLEDLRCVADREGPVIEANLFGTVLSPFDLEVRFDDPPVGALAGNAVDPDSIEVEAYGPHSLEINGVTLPGFAWRPIHDFLDITSNGLGGLRARGVLAHDSGRALVWIRARARDTLGNEGVGEWSAALLASGNIASVEPPSGVVPNPFNVELVVYSPFDDLRADPPEIFLHHRCVLFVNGVQSVAPYRITDEMTADISPDGHSAVYSAEIFAAHDCNVTFDAPLSASIIRYWVVPGPR